MAFLSTEQVLRCQTNIHFKDRDKDEHRHGFRTKHISTWRVRRIAKYKKIWSRFKCDMDVFRVINCTTPRKDYSAIQLLANNILNDSIVGGEDEI